MSQFLGEFGTVYKGTITVSENDNSIVTDVAVKTIKAGLHKCNLVAICVYVLQIYVSIQP